MLLCDFVRTPLIFAGMLLCLAAGASADSRTLVQRDALGRKAVLAPLARELTRTGGAAEIYYRAVCRPAGGLDVFLFPKLSTRSPSGPASTLMAIREIFGREKRVIVEDGREGLTRVRVGAIPQALLKTRIAMLSFDPIDRYNPRQAIGTLLSDRDIHAALKMLGLHPAKGVAIYPVQPPDAGGPHLPAAMRDVTFEEVLDSVAKTFHGIVLVGVCDTPSLYGVEFVSPDAILRTP